MEGRWAFRKEILKVPIERRRIEHVRKERVPTWHSKGRPILGVPKQCRVDLGRHLHTPLHHWTQVFYLGLQVV